jgi:hypothetical protein
VELAGRDSRDYVVTQHQMAAIHGRNKDALGTCQSLDTVNIEKAYFLC